MERTATWVRPADTGTEWSHRRRIAAAAALVAAGVLQLVEDVVEPAYDDPAARFAAMARDSTPFEVSKAFGIAALPFLLVTALVLLGLARRNAPRLGWTAGTMTFCGFVGLSVLQGVELVEIVALKGGLGVAEVQKIDDAVTGSVGAIPVVVLFLSAPLGLLLLAVALWRAGTAPRGALLLVVVMVLADFGLFGVLPFPVHIIWLAALSWIAWSLLARPQPPQYG
ncbi:hypothetical protein [Cryptosporangium minutisporangium]|uniref:DUF4386 family protein n=1 Tax=Cryptosporangium minutisporangium TaxID=113569 RepID=A0ABP6TCX3_9ACTN